MIKNERGYALVLVLVVMLALFMLGTALVGVSTSQVREAAKQQERVQAYYLAYSGANAVVEWVKSGEEVPEGVSDEIELDVGSFYVEMEEDGNTLTITSHGTVDGYTETVVVTLNRQPGGSNGGLPFPTDMAVFSNTTIKMPNGTIYDGPIGTNETETNSRLEVWCRVGTDKQYGEYAIKGAIMGKQYGLDNKNNPTALIKINDFDWLREQFDGIQS